MVKKPDILYVSYYTDGSAARKIAPSVPIREDARFPKRKQQQKRKVIYVDPVAILGLTVAVMMLVMMVVGVNQFQQTQLEMEQMESYVHQLQLENDLLQIKYDANVDMETVEKTALALGMVPRDQVEHLSISVTVPSEPEQQYAPWDQFINFLADLFA